MSLGVFICQTLNLTLQIYNIFLRLSRLFEQMLSLNFKLNYSHISLHCSSIILYLNHSRRVKSIHQMFIVRYVTQLIGQYKSVTYLHFDVAMRMSINPVINAVIGNKRGQLNRECTIDGAVLKFCCRA